MSLKMHRFKVDKLVRDNHPQIMRESGMQVVERQMDQDEFLGRLKDKIFEEAAEVMDAKDRDELCAELADLLEVMQMLAKVKGIVWADVEGFAAQKRAIRGGFDGRTYITHVTLPNTHPLLESYRKCADRYPEIPITGTDSF